MAHSMAKLHVWVASALALLVTSACGGESAPTPESQAQASPAAAVETPAAAPDASNDPPIIARIRFEPERPVTGDSVRAVVEASDPNGDPIWFHFAWELSGAPVNSKARELVLAGASKGDRLEVTVVAHDGKAESGPAHAATQIRNTAPRLERISIEPPGEIVAGMPIVVRPDACDADGDPVTFRYEWTVDGRPVPERGPSLSTEDLQRGDVVRVAVVATDGEDDSEPLASPKLPIVNAPPRVVSRPSEPSNDGTFRYQVLAKDPDGDTGLQFHLENAPDGMSIDALSGAVTWVPAPEQLGTHSVSVIVDDLQGGRVRHTFEVSVAPPDGAAPPASSAP